MLRLPPTEPNAGLAAGLVTGMIVILLAVLLGSCDVI